ncbi:MAG: NAD-dependent malic enzyme [Burkholderiales bacterium]|nr:NAD-dependent malic enzyme [Burkholderiales bacterium]MCE1176374.1 NAD-dependent malic enzyme [Burkholderiales bacterium]
MPEVIRVKSQGRQLLKDPFLNKGTAFTAEERRAFGIEGRLPPRIETLEEQIVRMYEQYSACKTNLEKYVFLREVQDYNRIQYYALVKRYLEEMLPIVYTPTVGEAIQEFSHIYREPRGLVVTESNYRDLDTILSSYAGTTKLAVVTDAEGILGIGDQGFGGIAICMGKLTLYSLAAGIRPIETLPVLLDFGTNNKKLLEDPFYLGVRQPRTRGAKYFEMIDAFVSAFKKRFPEAMLQWEDFSKSTAFDVLERYRDSIPSFNDDIQGTGAMALGGLIAATEQGKTLTEQVFLVSGAGAGGIGVASQIMYGLMHMGLTQEQAKERIYVLDSRGLILSDREGLEPYKKIFAHEREKLVGWSYASENPNMMDVVRNAKVTALMGLSGQGGSFNQRIIEAVMENTPRPIIFALSNPTDLTEILPKDAICWSDAHAIVATGSPFDAVEWKGKTYHIGQGNNTFVFPGIGWGVIAAGASSINQEMMTAAAIALSTQVTPERLEQGAVFPPISDLEKVTDVVARAVAEAAFSSGVATHTREVMDTQLAKRNWEPVYPIFVPDTDE